MKTCVAAFAALAALMLAAPAQAHITLRTPKPYTTPSSGQKGPPPCGTTLTNKMPTTYKPGETIMVQWDETIKHPGRFRIAIAKEGTTFPNPMTMMDTSTAMPVFIDGIDPKTGTNGPASHTRMVTLPNEPCPNCILQLIQVMKVAPPYNAAADADVYYQCAALNIAGEVGPVDAGAPDSGGGSTGGSGGSTGGMGGSTPTGGMSGGNTGGVSGGSTGGMTGSTGGKSGSTGGKSGGGDTGGEGGEETGGSGGGKRPSGGCAVGGNASGGLLVLAAVTLLLRRRRR